MILGTLLRSRFGVLLPCHAVYDWRSWHDLTRFVVVCVLVLGDSASITCTSSWFAEAGGTVWSVTKCNKRSHVFLAEPRQNKAISMQRVFCLHGGLKMNVSASTSINAKRSVLSLSVN